MNAPKEHEAFARRAKACFDESVERQDAATQSRLNRARHAALASRGREHSRAWRAWVPLTGVAAAAVVALLVRVPTPGSLPVADPASGDAELLFGEDNLEMLEELEFYYWMDEVGDGAAHNTGQD